MIGEGKPKPKLGLMARLRNRPESLMERLGKVELGEKDDPLRDVGASPADLEPIDDRDSELVEHEKQAPDFLKKD